MTDHDMMTLPRTTEPRDRYTADVPYRSAGERRIGEALDAGGVGFDYQFPRLVLNGGRHEQWRPAFTLPGHELLVIEYVGRPGGRDLEQMVQRQRVYEHNAIPVVMLTSDQVFRPDLPERLPSMVESARQYTAQQRYAKYGF